MVDTGCSSSVYYKYMYCKWWTLGAPTLAKQDVYTLLVLSMCMSELRFAVAV